MLALLLAGCASKTEQIEEPSELELEMKALYGENKVIEGDYPDSLAVETANGIFVGQRDSILLEFKGIPYAVQPTGERRWQVAQPEHDSRLVREARHFGHSAIQWRSQGNAASLYPQGEDCLTLNVWTAADGMRSARRPVMVWIHGGSYVSNGTVNPRDWGDAFVKAHPEVVLVSINYRLGLLGFLDLSSLPDGKAFARSGNLGILDQVEALRWVKRNIAAFGGDPGNVTIFGHSAGAGSISILASIDEAQGLFHRAIMQSGSVALTSSREDCESLTKRVLDATGAKTVADLQALSEDEIIALNDEVGGFYRFPERDGALLPEEPYTRFDGFNAGIDMLIGTTADESRYWIDAQGQPLARCRVAQRPDVPWTRHRDGAAPRGIGRQDLYVLLEQAVERTDLWRLPWGRGVLRPEHGTPNQDGRPSQSRPGCRGAADVGELCHNGQSQHSRTLLACL